MKILKTREDLEKAIQKLEKTTQKVLETRGYGEESRKLRILSEILREQLKNEDARYSTRSVR